MLSGLYMAASGLMAQTAKMDVLSDNLANSGTPGFKGDLMLVESGAQSGLQPAFFKETTASASQPVRTGRRITDFSRGLIRETGNPLDLANGGPGYFVVQTPRGVRFTRAGNFVIDATGNLKTQDGNPLLGAKGPIRVPGGRFSVDSSGRILVEGKEVDRLRVVNPAPDTLRRESASHFALKPIADGAPQAEGVEIRQGFLEGSNVDPIGALTQLMVSFRASEAYQKVIHALDVTLDQAVGDLGRI